MRSTAFCPGHLTGFFQVLEHPEIERTGSRGAGICLSLGATSAVTATRGRGRLEVRINGRLDSAPVTRQTIAMLMGSLDHDIVVETDLDLPISQGFGMSAAGAMSTAMAICDMMGCDFDEALKVAHHAEIVHRTGMGDVAALSRGGITFRRREGLPPYGAIDSIGKDIPLVIAIVGEEIPTSNILSDRRIRERIDRVGEECVSSLAAGPSLANFFRLCGEFATRTGFLTPEVEAALDSISGLGPSAMVMLGNSIFASGEAEETYQLLSERYDAYLVGVDWEGPRVIDSSR